MNGGWRGRLFGAPPPPPPRRERDEDLVLFKELFKREQERTVSLLEPVSDEFDPAAAGNIPPYKLSSGKKWSGYDFFAADEKKNDYDWLKTPPATPLFPSLELEAGDLANMVMHKELPIKPSWLTCTTEKQKQRPKSPGSSSASSRSVTPRALPLLGSLKPVVASTTTTAASAKPASLRGTLLSNDAEIHVEMKPNAPSTRSVSRKDNNVDSEVPRKPTFGGDSRKVKSRGTSPTPKQSVPTTLPGFTEETPSNLITSAPASRSTSATRGQTGAVVVGQVDSRPESRSHSRSRISCSPSTARGRKSPSPGFGGEQNVEVRGRLRSGSDGGSVVVGSRMVEKMMNARRAVECGGDKGPVVASTATTGGTGFGRLMSKSSLDMALKNLDIKKEPSELLQSKTRATNRNSKTPVPARSSFFDSDSPRVPAPPETRSLRGRPISNDGGGTVASKGERRNNNNA